MTIRLFIDECLSPELVKVANGVGYECACSRDRGLLGVADWHLIVYLISGEFTFVTNNANDFRGEGVANPGGLYARHEIHPGLICLRSSFPMTFEKQCSLFNRALMELQHYPDLINTAMEIIEDKHGQTHSIVYDISAVH